MMIVYEYALGSSLLLEERAFGRRQAMKEPIFRTQGRAERARPTDVGHVTVPSEITNTAHATRMWVGFRD